VKVKKISGIKDIKKVVELFIKVFSEAPYNETWTEKKVIKNLSVYYKDAKDFCIYVEEKGVVIGIAFGATKTWYNGEHLYIDQVAVHPEYRSKGVGTKMFEYIEKKAKQKKIIQINIVTHKSAKANNFWKKQGFKIDNYYCMKKEL